MRNLSSVREVRRGCNAPALYDQHVASNLSCIGFSIKDQDELRQLLSSAFERGARIGTTGDVTTYRWQDPSGARLVMVLKDESLVDFIPSFAGTPGVRFEECSSLNETIAITDVVDDAGQTVTKLTCELEQLRALKAPWSGLASIIGLAPDATFFKDGEQFSESASSLLDPRSADPGDGNGLRMATESFLSYGVFNAPADAHANSRLNGVVLSSQVRTNELSGEQFMVCRVRCLDFELELLTVPHITPPEPGDIVSASPYLVASIEQLDEVPHG